MLKGAWRISRILLECDKFDDGEIEGKRGELVSFWSFCDGNCRRLLIVDAINLFAEILLQLARVKARYS
jgi:hypothetical protein